MRGTAVLAAIGVTAVLGAAGWAFVSTLGGDEMIVRDARIVADADDRRNAKLFMTIENAGGRPDRLLGVSTDVSWGCGFHGPRAEGGATPYIDIPAAGVVELSPQTAFLDLSEIGEPVREGAMAPMVLIFERAGEVLIKARVDPLLEGEAAAHGAGLFEPARVGEPIPKAALEVRVDEEGRAHIALRLEDFAFDEAGVDGPHVPGRGHAHLYVDRVKIGRLYGPDYVTAPLPPGRHEISVVLNTNDHRAYAVDGAPVAATATVVRD
ncbi:MAG: copper chaperone PCu(A)C [Nitratireductor sp.]